jgi:hypothetical protein
LEGTVNKHSGGTLPEDANLFAEAPEEIGPVSSADSSWKKGQPPKPPITRKLRNAGIAFAVSYVVIHIIANRFMPIFYYPFQFVHLPYLGFNYYPFIYPAAIGALAAFLTRTWHACSYIGRDGIAYFTFRGDPLKAKRAVLRFADVASLRKGVTRHYRNGRYEGTSYFFRWSNAENALVFEISSYAHPRTVGHDWFVFAEAAESAWSVHLFERTKASLAKTGAIIFPVAGDDCVSVSPGAIELTFGGKNVKCAKNEIDFVSIQNGMFTIKRKDAQIGWFSREGIFTFPYSTMANAQVFLFALEKLGGIPLTK